MSTKTDKTRREFNSNNYTELDIMSTESYIINWVPKDELRIVSGAFILRHFKKCKVLKGPYDYPQHSLKDLNELISKNNGK